MIARLALVSLVCCAGCELFQAGPGGETSPMGVGALEGGKHLIEHPPGATLPEVVIAVATALGIGGTALWRQWAKIKTLEKTVKGGGK
jgi:hypothetical protein